MRPIDAIRAATIDAADLLGQSGKVGVLEKGYYTDIIGVHGNPLEDITILEDVSFIMKGGKGTGTISTSNLVPQANGGRGDVQPPERLTAP